MCDRLPEPGSVSDALAILDRALVAIHQWGWNLRLNPDGTTTATSPDGRRVVHSHSPPGQAA